MLPPSPASTWPDGARRLHLAMTERAEEYGAQEPVDEVGGRVPWGKELAKRPDDVELKSRLRQTGSSRPPTITTSAARS
ncbi:MAG: hypothetical protein M0C28_17775 [Candidatus Moduliflexus flocculans]|nr:hypothetical protein [Candidatus Moduliflexus flocculans]